MPIMKSRVSPPESSGGDGSRPKKIGLISKPTHAKPVLVRLEREGYEVLMLGGSPTELPPSLDCIVMRLKSCSHEASAVAYAANRTRGVPLVLENGVGAIVRAVNQLMRGVTEPSDDDETDDMTEEETDMHDDDMDDNGVDDIDTKSCRAAMLRALHSGGIFFMKIMDLTPKNITDSVVAMGLVVGAKARIRAQTDYEMVSNFAERTTVRTFRQLRKETSTYKLHVYQLYYTGKNNRTVYSFDILSRDVLTPDKLETLARMHGYLVRPNPVTFVPPENPEEDRTHFHSKHHRAYYVVKDKRWRVCDNRNAYIRQFRTRAEAVESMIDLDAKYDLARAKEEAEAAQAIENLLAQVESIPVESAPVEEPAPVEPVPEPKVEPVAVPVVLTPEEEVTALLMQVRELMAKHSLPRIFQAGGMRAHLLFVHLALPPMLGKCSQEAEGEIDTKDITKVTCPHCKTTDFYQYAAWSVANLTIGD